MQEVPGRASPKDARHPPFHRPPASRRWLTALAIALWAATVRAQTEAPLSFESALQLAVARAPELTAAEQAVAAYQERAIAGGQLPDPVLTAGLANLPVGGDNPYSVGADPMTIRRIGVMQKLTDREKRQLRQLRGEQAAARASAEKASTLAAIRRAVASAWLERGYAVKTRQLTESLRAEIALQIATVTPLVASGKAAAADLRAAEMMLVQADDRLEASRQREQIAVQALSRWLGPDAERPPGAFPDTTALTHDVRDVTAALAHHPELSVASEAVAIARTDVRLAEREKTPDWTIELAYQHRGERFADMVSLGVSVPLPLFAADRQDRDIRATRAALADAEARQRDVTQRHAAELRAMLEDWQRLGGRIETLETRLLPLARERVELLVAAYGGGSATLGQVLEARRAEVEARLQVLGLERDRALGMGPPESPRHRPPLGPSPGERRMTVARQIKVTLVVAGFAAALAAGYWAGQQRTPDAAGTPSAPATKGAGPDPATGRKVLYWHDPMVPGQKFDKPGKSPFMDMDLVPVYADEVTGDGVTISPDVVQSLGIRTAVARMATLAAPVEAVGTVAENERSIHVVQSRVNGYVEKLFVRANLDPVRAGQPLAEVFAPDWVAAQDEYLALRKAGADAALLTAARERLALLSIPDAVVSTAEATGRAQSRFTLRSPATGIVTDMTVRDGALVTPGMTLLRVIDLTRVWIHAEVPEQAAALVAAGTPATVRPVGFADRALEGTVAAILPQLSSATRTLRLRIELRNPEQMLKPGMVAAVTLAPATTASTVVVPSESLIPTGRRTVVITQDADGRFAPVEVETGREAGGETEIRRGIEAGQKVVLSGQFLIDSEASLRSVLPRLGTGARADAADGPQGTGTVDEIGDGEITLSHDPIESLKWPAMTMPFRAPKAVVPGGLRVGDRVRFSMKPAGEGEWELTRVEVVAGEEKKP